MGTGHCPYRIFLIFGSTVGSDSSAKRRTTLQPAILTRCCVGLFRSAIDFLLPYNDKIRTGQPCGTMISLDLSKGGFRRQRAMLLHRISSASPHSDGGAFYGVTHSQRKYHYACVWFVAHGSAKVTCRKGVVRSSPQKETIPAHLRPGSAHTEGI